VVLVKPTRLAYLMLTRVLSWLALLARTDATKDVDPAAASRDRRAAPTPPGARPPAGVGRVRPGGVQVRGQESHNTARLKRKYAWHSK
jgi:hypothetical protein